MQGSVALGGGDLLAVLGLEPEAEFTGAVFVYFKFGMLLHLETLLGLILQRSDGAFCITDCTPALHVCTLLYIWDVAITSPFPALRRKLYFPFFSRIANLPIKIRFLS